MYHNNANRNTPAPISAFGEAYNSGADYSTELNAFARFCALSVLKKLYDTTANENIKRLRAEVLRGTNNPADNIGDGYDLVQAAALAILEQAAAQKERDPAAPIDFERAFTIRRLDKRVIIRVEDSAAWHTAETMPIKEVFRAVRRYIADNASVSIDPRNGYTYIADIAAETEDANAAETVYYRLGKYADLGGYVTDFNGAETVYTAPDNAREIVQIENGIIERLNLTAREQLIINYRLQGYGYKAIATRLGVTDGTIKKVCSRLREKAIKAGYKPAE